MKKYFEILRRCPLFLQISDENLLSMLGCLGAQIRRFGRKETILEEGEPANRIGILLSGAAQIFRVDYLGNRTILGNIESADLFGESFACAGVKSLPVNVVANEDSEVLFIDCARVMHSCSNVCEFHRQLIYNLMGIMAKKNLAFHQKIEVTSKRTTREKLMAFLLLQAKQQGSRSFEIAYDRQELADYLEVDRSGLSAEISKLRKEGILICRRSQFELL